ncbi:hypothetical protein GCM10027341_05100 [Spirosoma knui]
MATIRFNTQFPGYEVLSELGRSNARILKARHLATGDLVAIKHFALNTDEDTLRRFQRESAIMTSINHPNIVKVREVRLDAELPYIVMELIEGGNVHKLIAEQGRLDVPTTIRLGLQMVSAFKAIHAEGIIHRDIKPENILYRSLPSGELHFLLTDFGVARLHEQSTTLTGHSLMTYEYASPEQFNDPRGLTKATDYYSLGVVLYECLNGTVPFSMGDQAGIVTFMNTVLNEAPPALTVEANGQPLGHIVDLIQGLLQKKATDRISDPDELTWLLKQADLDYLKASRTGQFVQRSAPPLAAIPQEDRVEPPQPVQSVAKAAVDVPAATPVQPREPRKKAASSDNVPKWIGLGLLVLAVGFGLYYFLIANRMSSRMGNELSTANGSAGSASASEARRAQAERDSLEALRKRQAEEKQRLERLRQEAEIAGRNLIAEADKYGVGLFGGIKDVVIKLSNPSDVTFSYVIVRVNYIKDSGSLYKSEKVYFNNVGPDAVLTRRAPDSERGTKVTCKILSYGAPVLDTPADSVDTSIATDSID